MKVLTFGWDYPPVKSGGLGVACKGLTESLIDLGVEAIFVLPRAQEICYPGKYIFADASKRLELEQQYVPQVTYGKSHTIVKTVEFLNGRKRVSSHLLIEEVRNYAKRAGLIAAEEEHDIVHAHDWVAYLAGIEAKRVSGKPLVLHVHATSFDQAGGDNVDPDIYEIERHAFEQADQVVTVSALTKKIIVEKHGVDPNKVDVVYNGSDLMAFQELAPAFEELRRAGKKIVLYHGRVTIQKGPDYFIRAARRVIDVDPNVVFVLSGWGDMVEEMMHLTASLGLSGHVIFAGALWGEERDRVYKSSDLFVMPSVSEPFGIVALEAMRMGTPVLISKQSGASEVLKHALRADFWDVEELANKILAAVRYEPLNKQLVAYGSEEAYALTWQRAAEQMKAIYEKMLSKVTALVHT